MIDVEKIIKMLETEDRLTEVKPREAVAKESLLAACNGDYDAINALLEEDIAIDSREFASQNAPRVRARSTAATESATPKKKGQAPAKESYGLRAMRQKHGAKECDATPVTVENPIPSPVRKRQATEAYDPEFEYHGEFAGKGVKGEFAALAFDRIYKGLDNLYPYANSKIKDLPELNDDRNDEVDAEIMRLADKITKIAFDGVSTKDGKKSAKEEVVSVTASESVFPEEIDFDEEAFAELFGLDAESVSVDYVPEEENEPEHIEIKFNENGNDVIIKIKDNGEVEEVVNAEIVEPSRFSAAIAPDEDGKFQLLVSFADEGVEEKAKTEGDPEAEGQDEDGNEDAEEIVEPAGLDMDAEYSDDHGIKPAKNAADKIKDPTVLPVNEDIEENDDGGQANSASQLRSFKRKVGEKK